MQRLVVALVILTMASLALATPSPRGGVEASNPGAMPSPLLGCPDVSGDGTVDLFEDIFGVASLFGLGPGDPGYHVLYDVGAPVNQPIDLFEDIFGVAQHFGEVCPAVDTEVVKATLWGMTVPPQTENVGSLAAIGYIRASGDVPGQGIHYVKIQNWDGFFDPQAPEGLVYNDGKLVAQLYVVDGGVVGWGNPPPNPNGPALHEVNIDAFCTPVSGNTKCSWSTAEGWHDHHRLCTVHIGTPSTATTAGLSESGCATFSGGEPACTVPITTVPCYRYSALVGWMGHLWNHQLNANWVDEDGDTTPDNGRFADCFPDTQGWKASNCPS